MCLLWQSQNGRAGMERVTAWTLWHRKPSTAARSLAPHLEKDDEGPSFGCLCDEVEEGNDRSSVRIRSAAVCRLLLQERKHTVNTLMCSVSALTLRMHVCRSAHARKAGHR